MKCPTCKAKRGALVDMQPVDGALRCPDCGAKATLTDLGYQPPVFTPVPGPLLTPENQTICRWAPCGLPFVANRGAHYCSEPCRFQARQAARKGYARKDDPFRALDFEAIA